MKTSDQLRWERWKKNTVGFLDWLVCEVSGPFVVLMLMIVVMVLILWGIARWLF